MCVVCVCFVVCRVMCVKCGVCMCVWCGVCVFCVNFYVCLGGVCCVGVRVSGVRVYVV